MTKKKPVNRCEIVFGYNGLPRADCTDECDCELKVPFKTQPQYCRHLYASGECKNRAAYQARAEEMVKSLTRKFIKK